MPLYTLFADALTEAQLPFSPPSGSSPGRHLEKSGRLPVFSHFTGCAAAPCDGVLDGCQGTTESEAAHAQPIWPSSTDWNASPSKSPQGCHNSFTLLSFCTSPPVVCGSSDGDSVGTSYPSDLESELATLNLGLDADEPEPGHVVEAPATVPNFTIRRKRTEQAPVAQAEGVGWGHTACMKHRRHWVRLRGKRHLSYYECTLCKRRWCMPCKAKDAL
uniref:Uncharacterized protein n=1 Tax=Eutreptiella gymnastica TaxID=73025 RepID=A0A7S1JIB0_9EUGL|mmetsp:Transcript_98916/g.170323  ORF Transcript_98916/g.170323 Transcript_98916/m.170323 type:complete len:217 (+) Transcript_98916:8-658(+)